MAMVHHLSRELVWVHVKHRFTQPTNLLTSSKEGNTSITIIPQQDDRIVVHLLFVSVDSRHGL